MASQVNRMGGDLHVAGNLAATTMSIPDSAVDDDAIASDANVSADKLQHRAMICHGQDNAAAFDQERVVYVCQQATAIVRSIEAGSIAAAIGDSTVTVDLHKNGTTILSAVITLDSANVAYTPEVGVVSSANLVDGDVLELVIDATIGTGTLPTGLFVQVTVDEDGS